MAQQVHLSMRQVSLLDSFLDSIPIPREGDLLPFLEKETHDFVGQDVSFVEDVHHLIPGPAGMVAENEDAAIERLLQKDHLDIEAARRILQLEILENALTVKHFRWIAKKLKENLLQAGEAALHKIPNRTEYARILMRLAEKITTLVSENALSLRPLGYVECLDKLVQNLESGFVIMKQTGVEQDVFVIEDNGPVGYSERLCSLASHLNGD